jgi:hypothetical protein
MDRQLWIRILPFLLLLAAVVSGREWTDSTGKFRTQAEFIELKEGKVHLQKQDGKVLVVPLERLSAADQAYVQERIRAKAPAPKPTPEPPPVKTTPAAPLEPSPASTPPAPASPTYDWLMVAPIAREKVTDALNEVSKGTPQAAVQEAERLNGMQVSASDEGGIARQLLIAAALSRGGKPAESRAAFQTLLEKSGGTYPSLGDPFVPYAITARTRLRFNEQMDPAEEEQFYEEVAYRSVADNNLETEHPDGGEGWFEVGGTWVFTRERRAAFQSLMHIRQNQLSIRFFQFLHSFSPFPTPYTYLFILLVIVVLAKLLTLPLVSRAARTSVQLRDLAPQLAQLQTVYRSDPLLLQRKVYELHRENNVDVRSGCLYGSVDLIFVIWVPVAMSAYSPQLGLDNAQCLGVDVTRFSFAVFFAFLAVSIVAVWLNPAKDAAYKGGLSCIVMLGVPICGVVAWFWDWPAYVFVFWTMSLSVGRICEVAVAILFASWLRFPKKFPRRA